MLARLHLGSSHPTRVLSSPVPPPPPLPAADEEEEEDEEDDDGVPEGPTPAFPLPGRCFCCSAAAVASAASSSASDLAASRSFRRSLIGRRIFVPRKG